jgi:drug/metabolite transporter (DMT)-like permease
LIWGSSFLVIKMALDELPVATLVGQSLAIGACAMVAFLLIAGYRLPRSPRGLAPLAVMGLLNPALVFLSIVWGEQYVDSGTTAVLNSMTPLISLVIAGVWLGSEPVTAIRVVGLVIGFAGAIILAFRELGLRDDPLAILGMGAMFLAVWLNAAAASLAKHWTLTLHPSVVAAGSVCSAAIYVFPLALITDGGVILPTHPDTIAAVVWIGLVATFAGWLLYVSLLAKLGATRATMVNYMFPVVGVALGVLVLGELLDIRLLMGTTAVVIGIVIVSLSGGAPTPDQGGRATERR